LYSPKEESGMESLTNRGIQSLSEDFVRTHGAADIAESTFMIGYAISSVLLLGAIAFIAFSKGPRKRNALNQLFTQKKLHAKN
jgi:hypothetical protein